jgi:hypothetical protein
MNPFPAMNSRSHFLGPAPLSAVASSEQVVTLRHVPTSGGCDPAEIPAAGFAVCVGAAEPELLAAATKAVNKRPLTKARRIRRRLPTRPEHGLAVD